MPAHLSPKPQICWSQQRKTGQGEDTFPNSRNDFVFKTICWWTGNSVQWPNVTSGFLTIPAPNKHNCSWHGTALTQTKPVSQVGRDGIKSIFLSCFFFQLKLFIILLLVKTPLKSDATTQEAFSVNKSLPQAPRDTVSREHQQWRSVKTCFLQLAFLALTFRLYSSSPVSCRTNFFLVKQS